MSREQFHNDPISTTYLAADYSAIEITRMLGRRRIVWPEEVENDVGGHVGEKEYIFVQNNEGADWTVSTTTQLGEIISRNIADTVPASAFRGTSATASGRRDQTLGVTDHTIEDGYLGWIVRNGQVELLVDNAGVTAGDGIMPSATAGTGATWAVGEEERLIGTFVDTVAGGGAGATGGTAILDLD